VSRIASLTRSKPTYAVPGRREKRGGASSRRRGAAGWWAMRPRRRGGGGARRWRDDRGTNATFTMTILPDCARGRSVVSSWFAASRSVVPDARTSKAPGAERRMSYQCTPFLALDECREGVCRPPPPLTKNRRLGGYARIKMCVHPWPNFHSKRELWRCSDAWNVSSSFPLG
jgi:hypothetical protein